LRTTSLSIRHLEGSQGPLLQEARNAYRAKQAHDSDGCRRFPLLTNAFSKKLDNLKAARALFFCVYNFSRIHNTTRIAPAMATAITDRAWARDELLPGQANNTRKVL